MATNCVYLNEKYTVPGIDDDTIDKGIIQNECWKIGGQQSSRTLHRNRGYFWGISMKPEVWCQLGNNIVSDICIASSEANSDNSYYKRAKVRLCKKTKLDKCTRNTKCLKNWPQEKFCQDLYQSGILDESIKKSHELRRWHCINNNKMFEDNEICGIQNEEMDINLRKELTLKYCETGDNIFTDGCHTICQNNYNTDYNCSAILTENAILFFQKQKKTYRKSFSKFLWLSFQQRILSRLLSKITKYFCR